MAPIFNVTVLKYTIR